ncbi:EF-hand [Rhizophagus irregularis]|uniref:EF-hand n=1 Tax=Rhizophagus irregularis TaxID=588596 RepID=A0A2I1ETV3_9GLOM|nr:EF-hand [Rhizophagus irregularis]PKK71064.1 EF-hand [Rhizophagus irregularis]PKY25561.1 EF-hand [Rhizophagus irregularis]CAB4485323.1 unnamed protein product [Rhizophagus irregularis]CAB5359036.1 unnamed protein product [Rhizophagus irregularis]
MASIPRRRNRIVNADIAIEEPDRAQIKKIFEYFDCNGNGGLSRAEVDKAVVELYPHLACGEATKAAAIDKAYKDANISKFKYIKFNEFESFIKQLHECCEEAIITTEKPDKALVRESFETFSDEAYLSLANVDAAVIMLYPHFKNEKNRPAIKQVCGNKLSKLSRVGWENGRIDFEEFESIIDALHYYNEKSDITFKKLSEDQIKKIFDIFDFNRDGILSKSEIKDAVIGLYPHLSKDDFIIERAYKAADTSQDGSIEFEEFIHLVDLLHYYNELSHIFKKLDVDKNGYIDFKEFKKGHELIGIDTILKEQFARICKKNDGRLPFDEFCIYASKIKLMSGMLQDSQGTLEALEKWETRETRET